MAPIIPPRDGEVDCPTGQDGGGCPAGAVLAASPLHHQPVAGGPPPHAGEELFRAAQRLVGTRFRLHGRDPATGLDCIGLVIAAYENAHPPFGHVPDDYRMRGRSLDEFRAGFARLGFAERCGVLQPADIALINCGHGQYHVALIGPESHIHAHAGLRRVVETPGMPDDVVAAYHFLTS